MANFWPRRQRQRSVRWHPSLEVGPGSGDPRRRLRRICGVDADADDNGAAAVSTDDEPSSSSSRRGRFALVATAGLAAIATLAAAAAAASHGTPGGPGPRRRATPEPPAFDPERDAGADAAALVGAAAAAGTGGGVRKASASKADAESAAAVPRAKGYRKLQTSSDAPGPGPGPQAVLPFGDRGASSADDERSMNAVLTDYDTSVVPLPPFYANVKNVWDTVVVQDQPLLWYVPKAGGNTLGKILTYCLGMVTASSMASTVAGGLDPPDALAKVTFPDGAQYVNVDPSTQGGLDKAGTGHIYPSLAETGAAGAVITQLLEGSKVLFSSGYQGRLFVMLRHPIKRVVDLFYYRQRATWVSGYDPELAAMSLEQFAASDRLVENFVVRSLIHKVGTDLTPDDVALAKHVLRQKFVVGIFEWFDLSVVRFEKYFGWWDEHNVLTDMTVNHCHYDVILRGGHVGAHPKAEPGTEAYKKIAVRNWADLELYFYAKNLFYRQAALITTNTV